MKEVKNEEWNEIRKLERKIGWLVDRLGFMVHQPLKII